MKLLVIIHGLVRPDLQSVVNVKNSLTEYLSDKCDEVFCLLSTWDNNLAEDQDSNVYPIDIDYISSNFDYYLIEDQPSSKFILNNVKPIRCLSMDRLDHRSNMIGVYHFYKKMITISKLFKDYDYFVFCRSDITVELSDLNLENIEFSIPRCFWINYGQSSDNFNDHFFISNNKNFIQTFSKLTLDDINHIIDMDHVDNPEKIYKQVLSNVNVSIIPNKHFKTYRLNRAYRSSEQGVNYVQISIDRALQFKN